MASRRRTHEATRMKAGASFEVGIGTLSKSDQIGKHGVALQGRIASAGSLPDRLQSKSATWPHPVLLATKCEHSIHQRHQHSIKACAYLGVAGGCAAGGGGGCRLVWGGHEQQLAAGHTQSREHAQCAHQRQPAHMLQMPGLPHTDTGVSDS